MEMAEQKSAWKSSQENCQSQKIDSNFIGLFREFRNHAKWNKITKKKEFSTAECKCIVPFVNRSESFAKQRKQKKRRQ